MTKFTINFALQNQTNNEEMVEMVSMNMKMKDIIAIAKKAGVAFRVGMTKEELVYAIESNREVAAVIEEPAASETLVAEEKAEGDVVEMTTEKMLKEIQLRKNAEALEKSKVANTESVILKVSNHKYENTVVKSLLDELDEMKEKFLKSYGEYPVMVTGVELFERPDRWNRLGKLHLMIPRGYMDIKVWNQAAGVFENHDFADFSLDAFYRRRMPRAGSGEMTLAIKEREGKLVVNLPKSKGKNENFYDIVLTRNIRIPVEKREAYGFNNSNLEAALSAFLQVLVKEFTKHNPENRHGFNESCMTCQHMVYLGVQDGTSYDIDSEDNQNTAILNQLNVEQLSQNGQYQPQVLCTVFGEYVDKEVVAEMNYAVGVEKEYIVDEEGEYRWPTTGQVVIAGKIVSLADMRRKGTEPKCAECPFYHKIEKKSDTRIAADLLKADGEYVSKYYADRADASRQVVETFANKKWNVGFPGEFDNPENVRVKGLGGVVVYASNDLIPYLDPSFVAGEEMYDKKVAEIEAKIAQMFHVAFNMREMEEEEVTAVLTMALAKPEGLDVRLSRKWDNAVHWLQQALLWAQEAKERLEREKFEERFFAEAKEGATLLTLDEVMLEVLVRAQEGYVDYSDVWAHEFGRYLDDAADEVVHEVVIEGASFYLEGGTEVDRELAAGGLQAKLQSYINQLVYGVRRDKEPKEALAKLKVSDEVRNYIASLL